MAGMSEPPTRGRFQFRLRAMFVGVTITAALCPPGAWFVREYQRALDAAAAKAEAERMATQKVMAYPTPTYKVIWLDADDPSPPVEFRSCGGFPNGIIYKRRKPSELPPAGSKPTSPQSDAVTATAGSNR